MSWGSEVLKLCSIQLDVHGKMERTEPTVLVGNHVSYLDIPVLLSQAPVVFLAKAEVLKWPIIGRAAAELGTIFVSRDSIESRVNARKQIQSAVEKGLRPVIFPSGTTSLAQEKQWRAGAFEIAKDLGIRVQVFRVSYSPLRTSAFIEDDLFLPHLWKLLNETKVNASLEYFQPTEVSHPREEAGIWQKKTSLQRSREES